MVANHLKDLPRNNSSVLLLQMSAPRSIYEFKQQLVDHFKKFPKLNSRIIKVGSQFFREEINESEILANQCQLISTPMDQN